MANKKLHLNTVIIGDALKELNKLSDNSIDVTVTSPPYNKRNQSQGWLVTNEKYSHFDDYMPEEAYQEWQINILNELHRVTKSGGSVFYNHKLRWVDGILFHPYQWITRSKWLVRQEIVWDRAIAANMRGWRFWQVDERLYWLYKPENGHTVGKELQSKHAKLSSIWRFRPVSRSKDHPAPFPLALPVRAIAAMPGEERKIILDPFCGTGTTLVAAKLLGHDYIGIDISPNYVELTKNRLGASDLEKNVVSDEISKHKIDDPFVARKKRGTITWPYGPKTNNGETDT